MLVRIDFRSGKPAYLQVVEQIRTAATTGTLRSGESLPSISSLSGQLHVNRNAIVRAYSELEGLGVIERQAGGEYLVPERRAELPKEPGRAAPPPHVDQAVARGPVVLEVALLYSLLLPMLGVLYLAAAALGAGIVVPLIIAAAAFVPLRVLARRVARRIVFHRRFDLPRVLRAIKAEAPSQPGLDAFIERAIDRTVPLLGARLDFIHDRAAVLALLQSFPHLRSARAPVFAGADLLMPVVSGDEFHGLLRLPPKGTGGQYDSADLRFLSDLAEQTAVTASHFRRRRERQESEYALDIQRGLLPSEIPQLPGFSIAGAWQPARAVGGDYYDVFTLGENELALVVADVSGKGVPAALLMANLQATVKAYATVDPTPGKLCENVNRAICRSITAGKFITFFYAVLDACCRRLAYANGGHNPPVLVREDGSCLKLEGDGPVLGVFPGACYPQSVIDLQPGDRLVMFTDGISEAADPAGDEFGEERLIALVRGSPAAAAAGLRSEVMQRVTEFCRGDFADDATVLTLVVDRA